MMTASWRWLRARATPRMGLAEIQEVRDAVIAFRESGKPTIAYAETFGEFGPGNGAYYLATAFDRIYLQPSGDIGLTGLMAESAFVSGTLEKLGLSPRMDHRYEYKNALNMFTEKKLYPAPPGGGPENYRIPVRPDRAGHRRWPRLGSWRRPDPD